MPNNQLQFVSVAMLLPSGLATAWLVANASNHRLNKYHPGETHIKPHRGAFSWRHNVSLCITPNFTGYAETSPSLVRCQHRR
jgi:hypothetical protein